MQLCVRTHETLLRHTGFVPARGLVYSIFTRTKTDSRGAQWGARAKCLGMFASRMAEFGHRPVRQGSVTEWLRGGARNPLGFASKGSNPRAVVRDSIFSGMAQACGSRECIARPDE